jgi:hypothetical protein
MFGSPCGADGRPGRRGGKGAAQRDPAPADRPGWAGANKQTRWCAARPHKAGGCGGSGASPASNNGAACRTTPQTNRPRSDHAAKGGGAALHQPRFAAHPQRGTGGERLQQQAAERQDRRREGARHNRCYANRRREAVAQQLCITPCYVKAQSDLPSRLPAGDRLDAGHLLLTHCERSYARRATRAPATARGLRFCLLQAP